MILVEQAYEYATGTQMQAGPGCQQGGTAHSGRSADHGQGAVAAFVGVALARLQCAGKVCE